LTKYKFAILTSIAKKKYLTCSPDCLQNVGHMFTDALWGLSVYQFSICRDFAHDLVKNLQFPTCFACSPKIFDLELEDCDKTVECGHPCPIDIFIV
jgi:hypothetical protein